MNTQTERQVWYGARKIRNKNASQIKMGGEGESERGEAGAAGGTI